MARKTWSVWRWQARSDAPEGGVWLEIGQLDDRREGQALVDRLNKHGNGFGLLTELGDVPREAPEPVGRHEA